MSAFEATDPASYRFWATETVRFDDLDMLGHVNNKAYSTYYESARIQYATRLGLLKDKRIATALVRLEIDFRKEILYPATLRLGVRILRIGNSSMTLACAVFNGDICASTSIATVVRFDLTARAAIPFTDAERAILEPEI